MDDVGSGGQQYRWWSWVFVIDKKSDDERWGLFYICIDIDVIIQWRKSCLAFTSVVLSPLDNYVNIDVVAKRQKSRLVLALVLTQLLSDKRVARHLHQHRRSCRATKEPSTQMKSNSYISLLCSSLTTSTRDP